MLWFQLRPLQQHQFHLTQLQQHQFHLSLRHRGQKRRQDQKPKRKRWQNQKPKRKRWQNQKPKQKRWQNPDQKPKRKRRQNQKLQRLRQLLSLSMVARSVTSRMAAKHVRISDLAIQRPGVAKAAQGTLSDESLVSVIIVGVFLRKVQSAFHLALRGHGERPRRQDVTCSTSEQKCAFAKFTAIVPGSFPGTGIVLSSQM